jgi:hypothetical protein
MSEHTRLRRAETQPLDRLECEDLAHLRAVDSLSTSGTRIESPAARREQPLERVDARLFVTLFDPGDRRL